MKRTMKKVALINKLKDLIFIVEMILAVMILFGVLAGLVSSVLQIPAILTTTRDEFYTSFKNFLGNALLLVVGVELIRMLITHTTRATLELIVFVIARKLLIYTDSMVDIFLGTVALAIAFATIKYLLPVRKERDASVRLYPAWLKISEVNSHLGVDIPVDGEITLDQFIHSIRTHGDLPKNGEKIHAGPVDITLSNVCEDGTILDVQITDSNFVSH